MTVKELKSKIWEIDYKILYGTKDVTSNSKIDDWFVKGIYIGGYITEILTIEVEP